MNSQVLSGLSARVAVLSRHLQALVQHYAIDLKQASWVVGIMKRFALVLAVLALFIASPVFAWDGTDENGNSVTIDEGNLVRVGESITYHNDADGNDHDATIDAINADGGEVEIELTDDDTGYSHTLTMERS